MIDHRVEGVRIELEKLCNWEIQCSQGTLRQVHISSPPATSLFLEDRPLHSPVPLSSSEDDVLKDRVVSNTMRGQTDSLR